MILLDSLSNYAVSIGLSQYQASIITALLNLGTAVGRPGVGFASDRLGRIMIAGSLAMSLYPDLKYSGIILTPLQVHWYLLFCDLDSGYLIWRSHLLRSPSRIHNRDVLDGNYEGPWKESSQRLTLIQTIAPLAAEVAGLREVPSLLSLTWLAIVLPTAFGEAIALYLRRSGARPYLYAQIFAGLAYCTSSLFLAELWRRKRSERKGEQNATATGA